MTAEIIRTDEPATTPSPLPRMYRRHCKFDELQPGDSIVLCNGVVWHDTRIVISVEPGTESDHFVLRTKDENGTEVPPGGAHYATDCVWLVERRTDFSDVLTHPSNLERHAVNELKAAGLFDKDSDYEGGIGDSVMCLVREFAKHGHSGSSGRLALEVFDRVAHFKSLGPLTVSPDEWMQVSPDMMPDGSPPVWQSRRQSSCFSNDGGKTYYDIDAPGPRVIHQSFDPSNPPKPTNEESTPLDQPPPAPTEERPIWERVIEMCERWAKDDDEQDRKLIDAMKERDRVGRARYGTPLQPGNGRNHIADALAEILDAIAYVANEIALQKLELDDLGHPLGDMLWRLIMFASILNERLDAATARPAGA